MKVGIQFSQPETPAAPAESLQAYLSFIELAWGVGFQSFWAGQHFLCADGYALFQPFTFVARAAAAVPGMTMGTSVMLLPLLNPLDVAEQTATLDAITGGRFILGVGLGNRQVERDGSGIDRRELVDRFEESIEVITRVWSEQPGTFRGKFFSIDGTHINPLPVQRPRPPLLIGAHADVAVERAGKIADGWIVRPELAGPELLRRLELFRRTAQAAGTPGTVALMRVFHVTRDRAEADEVAARVGNHFATKKRWEQVKVSGPAPSGDWSPTGFDAIVGDPDHCLRELERCRASYEPNHLILLMGFKGTSASSLQASIKLAGEAVLPGIRGA